MSETREELIARRDALIGQLQGEWLIDTDWKSISTKAFRLGLCLWIGGMIFLLLITGVMFVIMKLKGNLNMQITYLEFFALMGMLLFGLALIGSLCVMIQSWFNRDRNPIRIEGSLLVWDKGKGFVPEKLHLDSLLEVADTLSTGYGASLIIRKLGPSATLYSKHILVSEIDKNAPKITPGVFRDGLKLIMLLKEVASLNGELRSLADRESADH